MNLLIHSKNSTILPLLIALAFACFGLSRTARAVVPAPDGGYPGGNTAEGRNALFSLTTGGFNTGVGFLSLRSNTTNSFNTAVGYAALYNIIANGGNTAIGDVAGFNLTGSQNICIGAGVGGNSGESNTIRIADNLSDTQGNSACYIGGITTN